MLATTAMLVANLLLLSYWVLRKRLYLLSDSAAQSWLVFFAVGFLSASLATNTHSAFEQLRLYFSTFLLGLGFRVWFEDPSRRLIVALLLAVCISHVLILMLVVGHATGLVADALPEHPVVPYHGHIRHVAHHGMVAACAGLSLLFIGGRFRLAGYLLGLISIFGLVFLGQRGGLLGFGVFVAVAAYLLPKIRVHLIVAGGLAVLICLAMVYSLDKYGVINKYSGSIIERTRIGGTKIVTNDTGRLAVWKNSIDLAIERPFIGHGPDGYRTSGIKKPVTNIVQSHNLFIQTFVEFGFVGLLLVSIFLFRALRLQFDLVRRSRKALHGEPDSVLLFAMLMGFLAFSQVEGLFYHSVSLLVLAVLAPLTFAASAVTSADAEES